MTFSSTPSATFNHLTLAELRRLLQADMVACRQSTLRLVENLTDIEFRQQANNNFSPIGWHLGHIAFTESLWLLEHLKEEPCPYPHYQKLFAADGLPKAERENLPDLPTILAFMADIRDRTLSYLAAAPLYDQLRLWRWLLQHESQHAETATYVLALHRLDTTSISAPVHASSQLPVEQPISTAGMVLIHEGIFHPGAEDLDALDNERPQHAVHLAAYWIDQHPVTIADYAQFLEAGGYHNSQWWHPDGWAWVQRHHITQPLYWQDPAVYGTYPVCGVSWYEADAYACFVGKRLPTETEWEKAARWHPQQQVTMAMPWGDQPWDESRANIDGRHHGTTPVGQFAAGRSRSGCDDMLGNVWEWTSSWFAGYPGFIPYPYSGYSQTYFDRAHRVLRGGSWATRPWVLRPAFRNWYHPHMQQPFSGFRCALSV